MRGVGGAQSARVTGPVDFPPWRECDYRAHRKPKKLFARLGAASPTVSGPANGPKKKAPPRTSAPGAVEVVLAPARLIRSLLKPPQPGEFVEAGTQSATH